MRDVAKRAGVAVSTVSAVINGAPKVSAARTERVLKVMEALHYHPDQIARSLKVGRSRTIGVVVPDITNPFYPEVIRGIEDAARHANYEVLLCDANEDPSQEREYLATLKARRVDGVILACSDAAASYEGSSHGPYPLVFVDRIPRRVRYNAVSTDNLKAAREATRHLIELGHRRIAILAGDLNYSTHAERLEGFTAAMKHAGLKIRNDYLRCGNVQLEDGYRAGIELMKLKQAPTAVFASNNKLLLGLLRALSELSIKCPEEVSVLGFDDHVWHQHFTPTLTTVAQPTYHIGKCAFEMLLSRIEAGATSRRRGAAPLFLEAELRVRASTAPPAARNNKS